MNAGMVWRIGELLIQKKLINWEQLHEGLVEQKKTKEFLGQVLIRKNLVPKGLLYRTLAEQFEMRFIDIKKTRVNPKALELVPGSLARKYSVLPIECQDNILFVGIADPLKQWPEEEFREFSKMDKIEKVLCLPEDLDEMIRQYYPDDEDSEKKAP